MKVAVTGASGHVGANLCRALIRHGHHVKALIHNDESSLKELEIERIKGNLSDPASLLKLCDDAEIVFHLAAMISVNGEKDELMKVNIQGTKNLLDAVQTAKVRRLIHFSSIHALRHKPYDEIMDESRPLVEDSPMMYEVTKAAGEKLVLERARTGLDAVIFNPTAIIGPYDFKPSLVGQVLIKIHNRTLPGLVPGGYDWVDVRDIAEAAVNAIDRARSGERYILSGRWVSVEELAAKVGQLTGRKVIKMVLPTWVAMMGVPFMKLYGSMSGQHPLYTSQSLKILKQVNRNISNMKASTELGFSAREIDESLFDSIEWFKQNGYIK